MQTAVAILSFNRPDCTQQVLDVVLKAKPSKLFFFADGPRAAYPRDVDRCLATRAIINKFDWECEVLTKFSDVNLGCKYGPETGIDWVFEQVEEAIILEDDCLPDPSFFRFCEELLDRYRRDQRVMMIGGYNFLGATHPERQSYYFSTLASTWGWASWRRAWRLNEPALGNWQQALETKIIDHLFPDPIHTKYWYGVFERILDGSLPDAWDYQWQLACWLQSGFRIFPAVSLISNLGFGEDSTHTSGENPFANRLHSMSFPLKHPHSCVRSSEFDRDISEFFCRLEGLRTPPPPRRSMVRRLAGRLWRGL